MSAEQDAIIFIGLNKSASDEVKSLRDSGNKVIFIGDSKTQDQIKVGNKNFNLNLREDIVNYVKTFHVAPAQESQIVTAIEFGGPYIRDELAELAKVWADFEKKGKGATRFIISGHSTGHRFFSDFQSNNGALDTEQIEKIASALPKAAGMIEDLHLAACYAGKEKHLNAWRKVFPNIQSIWAYSDSAPGTASGSKIHLTRWDKATRGSKFDLNRAIVARTRKGQNVAVWTRIYGYQSESSATIPDLLARITQAESTYQSYFNGSLEVANPQTGSLRNYYGDLQSLLGHPLVTTELISRYGPRKEVTIRLLFFNTEIRAKFSSHHSSLISNGYRAIGSVPPNFIQLNRKSSIAAINDYESKLSSLSKKPAEAVKLLEVLVHGLKELDPKFIPDNWI